MKRANGTQTSSPPVVLSSIDFLFITASARGGVVASVSLSYGAGARPDEDPGHAG